LAAQEWASGIFQLADQLARFPRRGRIVPEVRRSSIRELIYGDYRVIYKIESTSVGILTVRHGRRRFDPTEVEGDR